MAVDDTFSMSAMLNSLPRLRIPAAKENMIAEKPAISAAVPPPGFTPRIKVDISDEGNQSLIDLFRSPALTREELERRMQLIFNLMTREGAMAEFKEMISKLDRLEIRRMASFLTSDSNYFINIATNKYGSKRLQKLLGKSDDADTFFSAAIMRHFLQIMTHKYATYVAIRAMVVFNQEKKKDLYEHTLHYALDLARFQHGCIALNEIITDADDPYYRNQLLDLVACNALFLSNDASGNFVVQHALKLKDLHYTHKIAVNLRGHSVDLSFRKHGSYIVERLLEAEDSMVIVVEELLNCDGDRLVRLARSDYGNFVVSKTLRVTQFRVPLFWGLVQKLMPFLHLLRKSRGSNIAAILDSIS